MRMRFFAATFLLFSYVSLKCRTFSDRVLLACSVHPGHRFNHGNELGDYIRRLLQHVLLDARHIVTGEAQIHIETTTDQWEVVGKLN